jgi:hypothetical protein
MVRAATIYAFNRSAASAGEVARFAPLSDIPAVI